MQKRKKLGTIKSGDNAFTTTCDYIGTINDAKEQAKNMGGNLVKITQLIAPTFISKCYKIQADVYLSTNLSSYSAPLYDNKGPLDTGTMTYPTLYIYRLRDTLALEPSYSLHLNNDSVIARLKSKSHAVVKLTANSVAILWASTESRAEVKLDAQAGHTYYLRCGMIHGELRLTPSLQLVDNATGAYEYDKLSKKSNNPGLEYLRQIH